MHHFDEPLLLEILRTLPVQAQSAFAQACAWRTLSEGSVALPAAVHALCMRAQELAHSLVTTEYRDTKAAAGILAEFENSFELDDDRVATCAYVTRHLLSGEPQEAAWAARRAYEATDQLAQQSVAFTQYSPAVEARLLGHPGVQAELECQAIDLEQLQNEATQGEVVISRAREHTPRRHA